MAKTDGPRRWLLPALLTVLVVGALGSGLWQMAAPPEGPVAVPFDRVSCARCRMLVSEPRFAAQLHDASGTVHFFDDPGCALLYRAGTPSARHLYFGHASGEAWLAESEVAFERVPESPMGYGFAAVRRGTAGDTLDASQVVALLDAAGPEAGP